MDLDTNEGSCSGDHLNTSDDSALNGNQNHSQASSGISIVHVTLPQTQVQSVIQPTSVIQSTPSNQSLSKGIVLVSKPSSVIHTTSSGIATIQVGGVQEDETTKKRREILARRPSYRKILNELGGCEISEDRADSGGLDSDESSSSPGPSTVSRAVTGVGGITSAHYPAGLLKVLPGAIQLATAAGGSQGTVVGDGQTLPTLTMTNTPGGGAIVQYATQGQDVTTTAGAGLGPGAAAGAVSQQGLQGSQHLAEVEASRKREIRIMKGNSGNHSDEWDQSEPTIQKRELRLLKNREAARECRRKKKEYIKCLENRVAVLENQNKALIEELKSLKELYCSQKTE